MRTERMNLPVPLFGAKLRRQGERALAIGSPLGFQNSVTAGIISGLHREVPGSAARTRRAHRRSGGNSASGTITARW